MILESPEKSVAVGPSHFSSDALGSRPISPYVRSQSGYRK
jgi:hypothetical protein